MDRPIEEFSLDHVKTLLFNDACNYVKKYFVPLTDGNHCMWSEGKFEIIMDKVVKSAYFNRMDKKIADFYFKEYTEIRKITYELNQPLFFKNYVNLCPHLKSKNEIPYAEHSENAKAGVQAILNFTFEVLTNSQRPQFNHLIQYIANALKGNKNDACPYLKGEQGIGKTTLFEFLKLYVVGLELFLETGSKPFKTQFNSILGGKLFVLIEELENLSVNEWNSTSSVLKRFITSNSYELEAKNINSYQTKNMNNYAICSNNDAIKDDDGRRYFILDVNNKYKDNKEYFGKLRNKSFNKSSWKSLFCLHDDD